MEMNYTFKVHLGGCGNSPEEAWNNAVEGFMMEPGPTPGEDEYTVEPLE